MSEQHRTSTARALGRVAQDHKVLAVKRVKFRRPNLVINRIGTRSMNGDGQLLALQLLPRHHSSGGLVYVVRCLCTECLKHQGAECGQEFQIRAGQFTRTNACLHCAKSLAASRRAREGHLARKYISTAQIDEMLTRIYQLGAGRMVDRKGAPTLSAYAKKLGWPPQVLMERARELGIQRPLRNPKYSTEEIEIIERLAPMRSAAYISRVLKSRGFDRTACAVGAQIKQRQLRCESDDAYSCESLARALGYVGGRKVRQWVEQGLLRATTAEGKPVVSGTIARIKRSEVKRFLRKHYNLIDLRKVEAAWLFDVVFDGRIGESTEQVLRETGKARATTSYLNAEMPLTRPHP